MTTLRYSMILTALQSSPPVGGRSIAISMSVCLPVCLCPLAYLKHFMSTFHQILSTCCPSSFGDNAIRYVLPVLWMTSRMFCRVRQVAPPGTKQLQSCCTVGLCFNDIIMSVAVDINIDLFARGPIYKKKFQEQQIPTYSLA